MCIYCKKKRFFVNFGIIWLVILSDGHPDFFSLSHHHKALKFQSFTYVNFSMYSTVGVNSNEYEPNPIIKTV